MASCLLGFLFLALCSVCDFGSAHQHIVEGIITPEIFHHFLPDISSKRCEGYGFYTYHTFTHAAHAFPGFGTSGDPSANKRELAAFFAHVAHETIEGCYINEINHSQNYCDQSSVWHCARGQRYYGRGPIQLSWNFNYGPAGKYLHFDGINNPDVVAHDRAISFKTAVWYWMVQSSCHTDIVENQDFGATIRDVNGQLECGHFGSGSSAQDRVSHYKKYCQALHVDPGAKLTC